MNKNLVRDWMRANPITIGPKTTLYEAYKLMTEQRIRRLPVMQDERLVGVVTLGDLREIITIAPDAPLRKAAKLMLEYKIGGLPVVENERVVGIITESDIFRVLVRELDPLTTAE